MSPTDPNESIAQLIDALGVDDTRDLVRLYLEEYSGLIVPGGFGAHALLKQPTLLEWIRHKTKHAEFTMSAHLCWPKPVCWMVCG